MRHDNNYYEAADGLINILLCIKMIRLTILTATLLLLVGCPATLTGNIKNQSQAEIFSVPSFETTNTWSAKPGEILRENWYQECLTIKAENRFEHYLLHPIPDNVVKTGMFSSSLEAFYKDGELD